MKVFWRILSLGLALAIVSATAQTIPDDPVVAPGTHESADHTLSFPVDI